jgi:mycothiol synthase
VSEELPEGFESSRPVIDDAAEVAALIAEMELAQEGESETTTADILRDWELVDTDQDAWLVRKDGRLAAYGAVETHPRGAVADGFVHPDAAGRGVGRFLVRAMEARAGELARRGFVQNSVSLNDEAGQRLLEAEGYRPVRRFLRMLVELDGAPVVPELPGISIRALRLGEEAAFHSVVEQAFAAHWGHVPMTSGRWWARRAAEGGDDLSLFFVAERNGDLVGEISCHAERFGVGFVMTLGVLPEARGLGIGRALLLRAFAAFWERGQSRVGLAVDAENETGATRVYEAAGMRLAFGAITFEKPLTGTVDA